MQYRIPATALAALAAAAAASALALAGSTQAAVGGPTCNVPTDYATIQAAVADPGCTTINVAPGFYAENVTIPRTLTLNGAQAGNSYAGRVSGGPLESTVSGVVTTGSSATITITAANVTVDGFTIKNNSNVTGAANGIVVKTAGNNASIVNNIFDTISTADVGSNGTAQAVYLENGPDGVVVAENEMKNVHSNRSAKGVLIGDSATTNQSQNVRVTDNWIHNVTSDTRGAYGVSVGNLAGTPNLQVLDNDIDTLTGGGWVHAVGLERDTPSVSVQGNDISNLVDLTPSVPSDSIAVFFEANPSFSTAQVHQNNFNLTAASFGIAVHPAIPGAGAVNGTCNWWNSPTGPTSASNPGGTGAQVSPRVTFAPWLIAPAPGGACLGGNVPTGKADCKDDGWQTRVRADGTTFKNQGDCIQYLNTGN